MMKPAGEAISLHGLYSERVNKEEDLHTPGAKDDGGKPDASLLLDFGPALRAVAGVGTFGARKYSRGGWKHVLGAEERYTAALLRHLLCESEGEVDDESGLLHATHAAWNALARLNFILERRDAKKQETTVPGVHSGL